MPKKDRDIITAEIGVDPVMINAALVSAQRRKRLFWCNWSVRQPEDRRVFLRDVLESGEPIDSANNNTKAYCIDANYYKGGKRGTTNQSGKRLMINDNGIIRKLTPTECERLQCFPDGYTEGVSNTQRYKQLGNAVNVEVVRHIMNEFKRIGM
jgi:site-specific DNA-cytosine methylase